MNNAEFLEEENPFAYNNKFIYNQLKHIYTFPHFQMSSRSFIW